LTAAALDETKKYCVTRDPKTIKKKARAHVKKVIVALASEFVVEEL
jgi:hypothetical protein